MTGRMFKYQISSGTSMQVDVLMCKGAIIRAVGIQNREIYAWAENPGGDPVTVKRTFRTIPTGGVLPYGTYIGTVFEGSFVWHVYEVT